MDDKDWYSKQGIRFQYKPGQPNAPVETIKPDIEERLGEEEIDEDMSIEEMVDDVEDTADFLFALNIIFLLLQLVGLILIGLDVTELSYFLTYRIL